MSDGRIAHETLSKAELDDHSGFAEPKDYASPDYSRRFWR
jgi:hypothetical protein